jgi:hypothetical protein
MHVASVPGRRRAWWAYDVLGVVWVLAAAGAVMAPALAHGTALGPYDIVARLGLARQPGVVVHNPQTADLITEMIPWSAQAWTQVHHGHLPLWNPYSALGMPLAFNWQSAVFSVPALVSYLAPLHLAYTVQVLVTLVIAGTGVYVLGRVLGLGALGCAMAATVYELSGPFFGWLGWPVGSVMSWAGWLFAATIVVLRGRRRVRSVALCALVIALAVYAGQPDALVLLLLALVVFVFAILMLRSPWLGGSGPIRRPTFDVGVAAAAGAALGAPLLIPGLQLTAGAIRTTRSAVPALPLHDLSAVAFQGFDGLPVAGSHWFGQLFGNMSYLESSVYVGVIAAVLAVVAVARRRQPEVVAMGIVGVAMAAVVFFPPVVAVLDSIPYGVRWHRGAILLAFALAVLAGVGTDVVARSWRERGVQQWAAGGFAVAALALVVLWFVGRGDLRPADAAIRARSFVWPAIQTVVGFVVVAWLALVQRRRPSGAGASPRRTARTGGSGAFALLVCETAFLITAGAPLWSSSATSLSATRSETTLADTVGGAVVGFGVRSCAVPGRVGIPQNVNAALAVHELNVYDPITPRALFQAWSTATGQPGGLGKPISVFCPAIASAAQARLFGVGYIVEPGGVAGPPGTSLVRHIGSEALYRVDGAAPATFVGLGGRSTAGRRLSAAVIPVGHPDPRSWRMVLDTPARGALRVHLTAVPGWHATIDGRPAPLARVTGATMEVAVPAGRHVVELRYWPATFSIGIGLAIAAVVVLLGAAVWTWYRLLRDGRRRGRRA